MDLNFEETGILRLSFAIKCLSAFACQPLDGRGSSLAAVREIMRDSFYYFSLSKSGSPIKSGRAMTAWEN